MEENFNIATFSGLIDLACEKFGGKAILASDEFFAPKENLLNEGRGIFIPDKYTENGKWMDGWESRRKRVPGYDWCIIKLGVPGFIKGIDIDTNHFLGNHPPYASVDVCKINEEADTEEFLSKKILWKEILTKSPLQPGSQNLFSVSTEEYSTHLRLNIFPDGGVARLRVYGDVYKSWLEKKTNEPIDLAAIMNGGKVLVCNDMFFGSKDNLISPGRSSVMGDGWETKRKRIPGYDWVILKLAAEGVVKKIIVDTNLFKGNFPDECSIEGINDSKLSDDEITKTHLKWEEILPRVKLKGHFENIFEREIKSDKAFTHIRLNIFPDGGVSRLRIFGEPKL